MYVGSVVRQAVERFHADGNLTDEQMKELNPIIRNAVYTALHAATIKDKSRKAAEYVAYHTSTIPKYWEEPTLLTNFKDSKASSSKKPARRATKKATRKPTPKGRQ